ncbi:Na+/H+ antiporter NhaA [Affinibrenneria salicis]|uniref:Na(+)/H(+) antiporter NhaA n=1 Tax=Affinibrenneria salicis TaxID=2590031 RepID=A0A5J5G437_9GAMM|nr:Na+/H+ antiporter NhaA [Affinibrenneria salicis]KAA9001780.1 Na+/H+ antiporter NhaA [Affinibrenneria salicis]
MNQSPNRQPLVRRLTARAVTTLARFLHIEAVSGAVLLIAAAAAFIWANSPFAAGYHALWHTTLSFGSGAWNFSHPLHFWINDVLMTIFFLVAGMEIRREIHEGALSEFRQALLPLAAAAGGVIAPAVIYFGLNSDPLRYHGWAVPTATDIAFAVGVLALLGRAIPANVRVFLLALAIIDDIIAVLIIAFFYSSGLDYRGVLIVGVGILLVLGLRMAGSGSAYAYVIPGALVWSGLLITGVHPTLAGVLLGLMTPVTSAQQNGLSGRLREVVRRIARKLSGEAPSVKADASRLADPVSQLRLAQRERLPPVVRVQMALHPWVAYAIMPLFALANAGVSVAGVDLSGDAAWRVMSGVALALMLGKPIGVIGVSWIMVKLGWCRLPGGLSWDGIVLIGLLAGIGFTMSIFIAMLAFADDSLLAAAKLGVLLGSLGASLLGLLWAAVYIRRLKAQAGGLGTAAHLQE